MQTKAIPSLFRDVQHVCQPEAIGVPLFQDYVNFRALGFVDTTPIYTQGQTKVTNSQAFSSKVHKPP